MKLLPTPSAVPYGNNQSPSEGAAVRPSLDGLVRGLHPSMDGSPTVPNPCPEGS